MELNQGEILQKPKMQNLSSLFMTHRLIVMYAPVKFHEYIHKVLELWSDTKVGRTDGQIGGGIKKAKVVFLVHDTSAQCHACTCIVSRIYSIQFRSYGPDTVYYMQLRQGKIIQKQTMQKLSS